MRKNSFRTLMLKCHFFDIDSSICPDEINLPMINVPVTVNDQVKGTISTVYIIGGFNGISEIDYAVRPCQSLVVMTDDSSIKSNLN